MFRNIDIKKPLMISAAFLVLQGCSILEYREQDPVLPFQSHVHQTKILSSFIETGTTVESKSATDTSSEIQVWNSEGHVQGGNFFSVGKLNEVLGFRLHLAPYIDLTSTGIGAIAQADFLLWERGKLGLYLGGKNGGTKIFAAGPVIAQGFRIDKSFQIRLFGSVQYKTYDVYWEKGFLSGDIDLRSYETAWVPILGTGFDFILNDRHYFSVELKAGYSFIQSKNVKTNIPQNEDFKHENGWYNAVTFGYTL